jgi:hypothetical protein
VDRKHMSVVGRRRTIADAEASPHLAGLSLDELRTYRSHLNREEDRVSYWRRLVHARIDLLDAQSQADEPLAMDDLVRVLGDTGNGRTRTALTRIRPADPLPELPVLAEIWGTQVDATDQGQVSDALGRLRNAEQQLSEYRNALHERIEEATAELIVRYRADPSCALAALPER